MAEAPRKNYTSYVLVGLLVVAAFAIGSLYTKNQALEKGSTLGVKAEPTNSVQNPPAGGKVDIKINSDDPSLGSKNAKVTLAVFSDFLCPYCAALSGMSQTMTKTMQQRDPSWQPAFPAIRKDYVDTGKVRIVWKDTPFHGDEAVAVHAGARCANDQGKFWEMHDLIFSKYGETQNPPAKDDLKKYAAELKLNAKDFNSCVDSDKYAAKIKEELTYAQSIGVNGTPATYVNGKLISGAAPFSQFKTAIEEELKR